jgi:hypothetical protein
MPDNMDVKDVAALVHFRELHFLPRVIFFVGTACFIGSFFVKAPILGLLGVGVMLSASALNLAINSLLGIYVSVRERKFDIPWMLLAQTALAVALSIALLRLAHFYYLHREMPPCLLPLGKGYMCRVPVGITRGV